VVIVTGAAGGIGREHALEFARQGASVVVNDVGPVDHVLAEIKELGGQAVGNADDVSDWDGAGRLVQTALDTFGELHVLVNNAGILRDKMFVNMDVGMWDDVMRVHLRGTFCPTRHAVNHWRARHKDGTPVAHPRIINTSSPSGLYGNVGQANYGAAKAALAGLTVILSDELQRLGITVNAIAPSALTQMTEGLDDYVARMAEIKESTGFDAGSPANIAPIVVWLASAEAQEVTGRVFNVKGGLISVAETWVAGPGVEKLERWDPAELGTVIPDLVARARPNSDGGGRPRSAT
jgi:NAD(P)-dependent dehydrogenase (short-subunit alcohol dehydrogenase family)